MKSTDLIVVLVLMHSISSRAQDHSHHAHPSPSQSVENRSRHVPPDPPQHAMRDMSEEEMSELMDMDDSEAHFMIRADAMEWRRGDADEFAWDTHAWYGNDYDKLWFKSEGETSAGEVEARSELVWDRIVSRWWSTQVGVRHDVSEGPSRTWAAIGVQGLAPYWFEIEAAAYVGGQGRTAVRFAAEYELLLTRQLVLEPKLEFDAYGKRDQANLVGAGISSSELALRLRFNIRPELAPYLGVAWTNTYGDTAALHRAAGSDEDELEWLAGVRWWF